MPRLKPTCLFCCPHPASLPEGEGAFAEPLYESPLLAGEGEGHACYDFRPALNSETLSDARTTENEIASPRNAGFVSLQ